MKTFAFVFLLLGVSASGMAQWLDHPTAGIPRTANGKPKLAAPAPRTADGKPDLSGLWTRTSRTDAAGFKPLDSSVAELVDQRAENFFKESGQAQCLPLGPGYLFASSLGGARSRPIRIRVLWATRSGAGRETLSWWRAWASTICTWLAGGYPHTEALRTVERYRRRDFGHLAIEVELHDPTLYAAPWTTTIQAELAADTELLEYGCNENETFHEHWVGTRSDAAQSEVALAADLLASYAGTYVEQQPFWQGAAVARRLEIRFADGALFLGQTRLVAQSETVFVNRGLVIEFVRDARGVPIQLWDKHVSGDYRFDRVQ
jgi:hypothetical protein